MFAFSCFKRNERVSVYLIDISSFPKVSVFHQSYRKDEVACVCLAAQVTFFFSLSFWFQIEEHILIEFEENNFIWTIIFPNGKFNLSNWFKIQHSVPQIVNCIYLDMLWWFLAQAIFIRWPWHPKICCLLRNWSRKSKLVSIVTILRRHRESAAAQTSRSNLFHNTDT